MIAQTIIALTLYGECGNQDYQSKLMVASVISQRARDSHKRPDQICRSPKQFSCMNRGSIYLSGIIKSQGGFQTQSWLDCVHIAYNLRKLAPAQGYTHYHTYNTTPHWAREKRHLGIKHGEHIFYKKGVIK